MPDETAEVRLSEFAGAEEDLFIRRLTASAKAARLHWHDYYQIYYVLQGNVLHNLGTAGAAESEPAAIPKGDMFIIPPRVAHRITAAGQTEFIAVSFAERFLRESLEITPNIERFLTFLSMCGADGNRNLRAKLSIPLEQRVYLDAVMVRMYEEYRDRQPGYHDVIRSSLISVLTVFSRLYAENPINQRALRLFERKRDWMQQVAEWIEENLSGTEVTLERAAQICLMSRSAFCAEFRRFFGASFKQYLIGRRMECAIRLLKTTDMDIIEVVYACGYNDASSFYRHFRNATGSTPRQIRDGG